MKKILSLILVMILLLVTLTGCVNVEYAVKLNRDGSGDITYVYAISKQALDALQMTADELLDSSKQQVTDSQYTLENYETDEEIGFKATKHIGNVTTELSLEEAFGEEYIKDSDSNGVNIEKKANKTIYSQNAVIDLTSSTIEDLSYTGAKIKYSISSPGEINLEKTNGTISEDKKTVTWELKLKEKNEIKFEAIEKNNIWIWIVVGVIGALAIVGVIIFIILKSKSKKSKIESETIIEKQIDEGTKDE